MKTLSLRLKRRSLRLKVPSPCLNNIKTWLRIFLEPHKNKFRVWSQLKTERFQERKQWVFLALSFFFNRAKMFPCEKLNQFLSVFVASTRLKSLFFWLQTAYYICVPFHFEPIFHKFCRANALEKSFAWLQTAFAWKVKLVSTMFDWVQNSLFFTSLICQKKQQTRILDHSLKSVILRPQFKGRNFGKTCLTELEVKMCKSVS